MAKPVYALVNGAWVLVGAGSAAHTHEEYLTPADVVAGTNVTVDTTTTPGSVIVSSTASGAAPLIQPDAPSTGLPEGTLWIDEDAPDETISSDEINSAMLIEQATPPPTPPTERMRIFAGADGKLRSVDDAGVVTAYGGEGAVNTSVVDAKGDLIVGTANDTVSRLPVGTDGTQLVADSTQATGLRWANPVTSPTIDLPLDTLTGWTIEDGAWTIASGVIRLSESGTANQRVLRYNTRIAMAMVVAEVEMRIVSGSGSYQRGSIGINSQGSTGWPVLHYMSNDSGTTWTLSVDQQDIAPRGTTPAISGHTGYGTWHTIRGVFVGDSVSGFVDGVKIGNWMNASAITSEAPYFTLGGYNAVAEFRNLKVWDAATIVTAMLGI